jgi:hypothetical protein
MSIADILWMAFFLGGAGYLLYRSFWKKKGGCHGCGDSGCCGSSKKLKTDH